MRLSSLIISAALLALAACDSSLDVPTKRIDTQLTDRLKVRSVKVNASIEYPDSTVIIDGWQHDVTTEIFNADTLSDPPHIVMDYRMHAASADTRPAVWLKEVALRLDDVKAHDVITLATGPGIGSRGMATVVVGGREYSTTIGDNASGTFHYTNGAKEMIQGTIVIGMERSPMFTLLLAVNFTAE